ncbi:MAG: hypothetical protein JWQ78_76, partial [Sediminibacterium sp.]|nr:hypothetical protein [Sediminibacterium sp.]
TNISLALLLITLTVLVSCKKETVPDPVPPPDLGPVSLRNSWELRSSYGGFGLPNRNPNFAAGNGNILIILDSTYEEHSNGQLQKTGPYTLTKDTCRATGRFMDAMVFDRPPNFKRFFEIVRDTLVIYIGVIAADGMIEKFVRIGTKH